MELVKGRGQTASPRFGNVARRRALRSCPSRDSAERETATGRCFASHEIPRSRTFSASSAALRTHAGLYKTALTAAEVQKHYYYYFFNNTQYQTPSVPEKRQDAKPMRHEESGRVGHPPGGRGGGTIPALSSRAETHTPETFRRLKRCTGSR